MSGAASASGSIRVLDDFLDRTYFKSLSERMLGVHFPWYKQDSVVSPNDAHLQFTHIIFSDNRATGPIFDFLSPCLDRMKVSSVIRIGAKLLPRTETRVFYDFHVDITPSENVKTAILYLNSNNGVTMFRDDQSVSSVANRMLRFPGSLEHRGTSHTDETVSCRCLINFNYY